LLVDEDITKRCMAAALAAAAVFAGAGCKATAQGPVDAGLRGSVVTAEGRTVGGMVIVV
jgi:hypothetical protein